MDDIYVLGELLPEDRYAVAVVGSRNMSSRGKELTIKFVRELVKHKVTIISGLALGIDTVAHETALKEGGRTVAVLGSGVDVVYPLRNKNLAAQIQKHGAIISGFPMGTKPLPENFLARNGLIVKMSLAVLVVEGQRRSGTISTANHAATQAVEVFAIPGSPATNYLIDNGATIATSAQVIVEFLQNF